MTMEAENVTTYEEEKGFTSEVKIAGDVIATIAGLAATDPTLVPYGAMTATFYTGLGCLLCPSVLHWIITLIF